MCTFVGSYNILYYLSGNTGAIPRNDGHINPLEEMTEEEKEAEAEKLAVMLRKLNSHGIITAMTVDPQGGLTPMKLPGDKEAQSG